MGGDMTYEQRQAQLTAEYDAALSRALRHIAMGTEMSAEERAAEKERARVAGLAENANWSHRTPSPLYPEQVLANIAACTRLRALAKLWGRS